MVSTRAVVIGTAYTFLSFVISILFLHIGTMYWYHQTAFEFLGDMNDARSMIQQQTSITNPGSFQDIILRDKVFYSIIILVFISVWLLNINSQVKREDNESSN